MQVFAHGKSAQDAHQAILDSLQTMENAKQNAVLWFADIQRRKLYRDLGYPSMNMYATQALGFSSSRASEFTRLADKLDQLPQLRAALEDGEIGYTKASQEARVSNKQNEGQWLAQAKQSSRRQLEQKIKQARKKAAAGKKGQPELLIPEKPSRKPAAEIPAVVPVRLTIEFSPEEFAQHEALLEKINKTGRKLPTNKAAAMLELLGAYLASAHQKTGTNSSKISRRRENTSAQKPAPPPAAPHPHFQIHLHRCPDCARNTVQTSRGEIPVSETTAERAACDARTAKPDKANKHTIPPRTRQKVLARDRHRCRRPGCSNSRYLEIHHIRPRSQGGGNEPENLVTLCSACHQLVHEKKWSAAGMVGERPPAYLTRARA